MLKVDKKFIDEFLGAEGELKDNYCSPCKTYRFYSRENKMLIVRTPIMYDFDIFSVLNNPVYEEMDVKMPEVEEHRRGKYLLTILTYN